MLVKIRHYLLIIGHLVAPGGVGTPVLGEEVRAVPLEKSPATATGRFTRMPPKATGIFFRNELKPEHIKNYLLLGAGLTVGDYDGDGLPDLFLCSQDGPNKLFRQVAAWKFEDVTAAAGIRHLPGWSAGAAFVDTDNDGDLDLFVCNKGNHNELYRNQGDGTFKGGYVQQSNPETAAPTMAAFGDYDRDGDLDLYLTRTRLFSVQEMFGYQIGLVEGDDGKLKPHPQYGNELEVIDNIPRELGGRDQLFENVGVTEAGIPRFIDVSEKAGIEVALEHGLAAVWWDANNDDWPDLYISNDFHTPDHLYLNQQDGTFKEITGEALPSTSWSSMGSDFADINNDGWVDYLTTDMAATTHFKQKTMMGSMLDTAWLLDHLEPRQYMRNMMLVNTGTGRFLESAQFGGIASTDWTWAAIFGDLDNDGLEDVFFTNGIERNVNDSDLSIRMNELKKQGADFQEIQKAMVATPRHTEKNLAFRNAGGLLFDDISESWGLDENSVSHGAVFADLDRDGDLDLVVNNMNDPVSVYRNDMAASENGVLIELRGTKSNRFGLGARVVAETSRGYLTRILTSSRGYMSGAEPVIHLGLGEVETIDKLTVHWPSGKKQRLTKLQSGNFYTVNEPQGDAVLEKHDTVQAKSLFADVSERIHFTHREDGYDDFADQPLLPNRMSRFGPALAAGDVNGDGLDDLYAGGAKGQAGALFLQSATGTFTQAPFAGDASHEDTAAAFVDWDDDGDLDLYVASGGASEPADGPHYHDRLYQNDGKGVFSKAKPGTLPTVNSCGSCVAVADFDQDGDQDLFVGARFVPKRYPHAASSSVIVNGEQPTKATFDLGLVTAAVWADIDGDSWLDLLVSTEWGSPRILRNEKGILKEATSTSGLSTYTGWWTGIAAADIDRDGDTDFVATNFGLNTKYEAHPQKPVALYAGDFGGDGSLRLVEAAKKEGKLLPLRGRSCSTHAMPHLAKRFTSYRAFASATLSDIYTPQCLDEALKLEATTLASMAFINDGRGRFRGVPLPTMAQLAPGFGVLLEDLDGDGQLDCFIAQNFYHPQRETGRLNAGLNAFLKGAGDGTFQTVWPEKSGLTFRDDSRGAIVLHGEKGRRLVAVAVNGGRVRLLEVAD